MLLEELSDTKFSGFLDSSPNINNDIYCLNKSVGWSNGLRGHLEFAKRKNILEKLESFKDGNESVLFIDNFPIGNLPNTPTRKGFIENEYIVTPVKFIFALFSLMRISPVSYIGENYGKIIRHVVPRVDANKQVSSHGYVEFNYHVDNPDLSLTGENISISLCPEYLALFCLRGDESATTEIIELKDIIKYLSEQDLEIAQKSIFNVKRPDSFEDGNPVVENLPLIFKRGNRYLSRFDFHNVSSKEQGGIALLDKFKNILEIKHISRKIVFKQGDFLIFKNQETFHKRSSFTPSYDGSDRWILRMFGMSDIPSRSLYNQIILKS